MLLVVYHRVLKLLFDQKFIPDFHGIAKTLPTFSAEIGGTDGTSIFTSVYITGFSFGRMKKNQSVSKFWMPLIEDEYTAKTC